MNSEQLAWQIRRKTLDMVQKAHASHIGAIYSATDIIAVLYAEILHLDPQTPQNTARDRFILSKGHAGAAVYAALAFQGFFPVEKLSTYYTNGGRFSGHVSHTEVPGVELSTGSLGHGLSVGAGMALAGKLDGHNHRVFVVMGDGECDEGSVWEAALFAPQHHLSNLVAIVDHNGLQGMGRCDEVLSLGCLADKWRAFGWHTLEVDGHDHVALKEALMHNTTAAPLCIVAHTVKGKGVSFMENQVLWHYRDPQGEAYEQAVAELEETRP